MSGQVKAYGLKRAERGRLFQAEISGFAFSPAAAYLMLAVKLLLGRNARRQSASLIRLSLKQLPIC